MNGVGRREISKRGAAGPRPFCCAPLHDAVDPHVGVGGPQRLQMGVHIIVECGLTEKGDSVVPILRSICQWAGAYHKGEDTQTMIHCQRCDYK